MDKEREVKELKQILFNNFETRSYICGECSLRKCEKDNTPHCGNYFRIAKAIIEADYGDIKQYQNEIERLQTELSHREEDLVHADEKVFYREVAVKLEEDKIKQQAVREFAERLKEKIDKIEEHCLEMHNWQGQSTVCEVEEIINELLAEVTGK